MRGLRYALVATVRALSTRRLLSIVAIILLFSFLAIVFSPDSTVSTVSRLNDDINALKPKIGNPFGGAVHKPAADNSDVVSSPDSSSKGTSASKVDDMEKSSEGWFGSSWWHNPFSSSIASAEDRIALPMLEKRCMVFAYHDPEEVKKDEEVENRLLLAWRRAWWANGFMPLVLGEAEAKKNPLYPKFEMVKMKPEMKREVMRWLAWGTMGRGALVNHRVVPMGPLNDETLLSLKKCTHYDAVTRYEEFGNLLYSASKSSLESALNALVKSPTLTMASTIEDALTSKDMLKVAPFPKGLADYTPASVSKLYGNLEPSKLPELINAHLHATFLSFYSDGIEYLAPFAGRLNAVNQPAIILAHRLANCPTNSPIPISCPPNNPSCSPCNKRLAISSRPHYQNSSTTFLIGLVPHPFTTVQLTTTELSLSNSRKDRAIRFIRRKLMRDPWVLKVTDEAFDNSHIGPQPRVVKMKEVVVSPPQEARTGFWGTDKTGFRDVEWGLGFTLPEEKELKLTLPPAEKKDTVKLTDAMKVVGKCEGNAVCRAVEAWCMADTELWKFVNAWTERREAVRVKWSSEERRFGKGLAEDE